jgi:hypothetical protein
MARITSVETSKFEILRVKYGFGVKKPPFAAAVAPRASLSAIIHINTSIS